MNELYYSFGLLDKVDFIILSVLFLLNLYLWRVNTKRWFWFVGYILLLGLILPSMSMDRETAREVAEHGAENLDGFNLLYAFLVFPSYWIMMAAQIIYLIFKPKITKAEHGLKGIIDVEV